MKRTLSAVSILFLIATTAQGADWPQYRADAGRSGYTPEKLSAELSLKWIYKSPHAPMPAWKGKDTRMPFDYSYQPVIADGILYYGSSADCKVYALDAVSGEERWTYFTEAPVRFAPAVWKDRLFVVSDDGNLYCLSAKNGKLMWKKRGGPENTLILGNDRMISRWPARGGVAIAGDTVYFSAGIWPTDGIFIYAVDAETGTELWVNDDSGGMLYDQPHGGAIAKSGVSSHGYLVVEGDKLLVPTGRAVPAAFDRETGTFEYFHLQKHRTFGGSRVMAFDGLLFVDNNSDRQTTLSAGIIKGIFNSSDGELISGDMIPSVAVASSPGHILFADEDAVKALDISNLTKNNEIKDRNGNTLIQKILNEPSWSIDTPADPGGSALIVAGNTIISATSNNKVAVMDAESKEVIWSSRVDGVPCGLAVAEGRLYVSTDTGMLYCYDDAFVENPKLIETVPVNFPYGKNAMNAGAAREIIRKCGVADGYCLDIGCGDGALAFELAKRTNLHIVAVDSDPENVSLARKKLDSAGLYGVRVTVLEGDPDNTSFPDYFANLIVSGRSVSNGTASVSTEEVSRIQRPHGGIACIGKPGSMKKNERGGLDGAGEWTHQYHDPANTITSEDELVKGQLGMLWFRDDDYDVPSRHGRGVAPLYSKGRLFYEGTQALRAIDAYNGRTIWEIPLMDVQKAYDAEHLVGVAITQSNICLEGDRLFVRTAGVPTDGDYSGRSCLVIDVSNGRKIAEYRTPPGPEGDENRYWGYIAVEDGILFGSIADPGHVVNYAYRESDMNKLFSESIYFFAMDAETGQLKWTYTPEHSIRHNAIAIGNGRVYLIDRPQAVTDRIRNPHKRENPNIEQPKGKLVALDAKNGSILWENDDDIYGTLLTLSTKYDALIMTYQFTRFRQFSELGGQMAVFNASDGRVKWNHSTVADSTRKYSYSSRPVINDRTIFLEPYAWDLVSGQKLDIEFSRTYACGILTGSKNMMLYRSGTVGYYDLTTQEETENFGGIRPGCWINAIPAGGLVLMPDATDRCNCSYLNKASVALKSY